MSLTPKQANNILCEAELTRFGASSMPVCNEIYIDDVNERGMNMAVLIDQQRISATQRAELYEEGVLWIIDDSTHQEIKLDVKAGAHLYAFLHFHDKMSDLYQEQESE